MGHFIHLIKVYACAYNGTRLFSGFRVGLGFKNPNPKPEPKYPKKSGSQPETRTKKPEKIGYPTRNPNPKTRKNRVPNPKPDLKTRIFFVFDLIFIAFNGTGLKN